MAIVDELKRLIKNRGGETRGVRNIADAAHALAKMEDDDVNPLKGLKIDVDVASDTDLLGKVIGDLQEDVVVDEFHGKVTGTLNYVTGYTGFSGDPEEQEGNYLVLHASVPDVTGYTITVKSSRMTVTLDSDGILVYRYRADGGNKLVYTASKEGNLSVTRTLDIGSLVRTPKAS